MPMRVIQVVRGFDPALAFAWSEIVRPCMGLLGER